MADRISIGEINMMIWSAVGRVTEIKAVIRPSLLLNMLTSTYNQVQLSTSI